MARYVRRPDIEAAPMQQETILYNPSARAFCVLNPTAACLWEQLAEPRTEPELAAALQAGFAVDAARDVPRDVRASLERFETLDLIVPTPDRES